MQCSRRGGLLFLQGPGLLVLATAIAPVFAASGLETPASPATVIDAREQLRQQERERALQQQNTPRVDEHLPRPEVSPSDYPADDSPCFVIKALRLTGDSAAGFQWALDAAAGANGRCLGGGGIMVAINKVQNAILAKGYVTTRVLAQEQDLTRGLLTLTLVPGRVGDIRFDEPVSWRGRLWNAIPASPGDILNLRDIEQGLENLKRAPSAAADIRIAPGQRGATSDLLVSWHESRPIRLSLGLDDSGSHSTGRYLGSATLAVDAPFAHNDLFYANVGRDLFPQDTLGSRSHALNYVFPLGYWAYSVNYSNYAYHQNIPSASELLRYSGKSASLQVSVSRLVYRDQAHKTTLNLRAYRKYSTNAVNEIDIGQQRRRTAGWELGVTQRSYLGSATLDANLAWRHGTGAFGAQPAPEEASRSGSARGGVLSGDISVNQPFVWGTQPWRYLAAVRGQWSPDALTPQERMAIAGRYTVRGFDGEQTLSGENGLLWRNELAWNGLSHSAALYVAVDYGRVGGQGARYLVGRQLAGGALGLRGVLWDKLGYDLFAGAPIHKPHAFRTSAMTLGFSLNLEI
ncbi:MAG: ShlB/FhaC/HecB family hemolysin secretion/activation protein [Achromobacter sp.]|uniref:ShlB/FhaC/HecB family hemolysin secretion/activation protein n=1 Tax=Achromobacter sp. TaxID=134375 RepID=UPI003D04462C